MLSFKSLVVVALALTPFSAALTVPDRFPSAANDLARRDFRLTGPNTVQTSRNKRMEAAALRNAITEKRKAKRVNEARRTSNAAVERGMSDNATPLERRQRTAPRRCGSDEACANALPPIANGTPKCGTQGCVYLCASGYQIFGGPGVGASCVRAPTSCGTKRCPPVALGYNTCTGTTCNPACQASADLTLYTLGQRLYCLDYLSDVNNCGSARNVCPTSYNGAGTPFCSGGVCTLSCPPNTRAFKANSATNPTQCQ